MADPTNESQSLGETGIDAMGQRRLGQNREIESAVKQLQTSIKPVLKEIEDTFAKIGTKLKSDIASALPSGAAAGVSGVTVSSAKTPIVGGIDKGRIAQAASGSGTAGAASGVAGASSIGTKMLGGFTKFMGNPMVQGAMAGAQMGITAANNRFDRGREGVLEADRMSVLYQQMTGLSQLGVSSQYRMPLTNYRLGAGGINTLMGMEASIGISGSQQASSVEAMRTMSGYSLSASDVTGMMGTLASAPVANRMFMMTGMGLIGPGGTQNSMLSVMQNLVRTAGLTDPKMVKDALLPGSITRAKLTAMGVPPEMQTQVIQYAQQNLTYKNKGGQGMYDPSREGARRMMGIEENFATQVEETQRLETRRDETFYRRQVDNYAHLERQTQTLTRAFGALEDKLSGILGLVGSNRIATSVASGIMGFMGDGTSGGSTTPNTNGSSGLTPNAQALQSNTSFKNLHSTMQERISRMMMDNPKLGLTSGWRSSAEQRKLFTSRYKKTSSPTNGQGAKNILWDGSYWEHVSGAKAAPPGRSMHEIGLAADLFSSDGDYAWIQKNAAKYGLKAFDPSEPWHVQPVELPNARSDYEKAGASWGHGSAGAIPFDETSNYGSSTDHSGLTSPEGGVSIAGTQSVLEGGSISERVSRTISGSSTSYGGKSKFGKVKAAAGTDVVNNAMGNFAHGGAAKSGVNIETWSRDFLGLIGAPVTRANLEAMSAWIEAEGTRAAFNPLAVISKPTAEAMGGTDNLEGWTDFNSHTVKNFANYEQGLKMNAYHIMKHGKGVVNALKSNTTNPYDIIAAIEKMVYGWTAARGITYAARGVLEGRHVPTHVTGDGSLPSSSGQSQGTSSMSVMGGTTINVNPVITMNGGGSPSDLRRIAKEVAQMIRRELELQNLRSS